MADAAAVLAKIKVQFPDFFELDGVSVDRWDAEGWWFNVRMSNTEPLVRLNLEAKTPDLMAARRDAMLALAALGFSEDIARAKVQQVLDGEPGLADVETILKRALAPG